MSEQETQPTGQSMTFSDETLERIAQKLFPMDTEFTENERANLEEIAWDWFQTSDAYCEPLRRTKDDNGESMDARNAVLIQGWMDRPREYHVADCEECDWVMGGWLNAEQAAEVLKSHVNSRHVKK